MSNIEYEELAVAPEISSRVGSTHSTLLLAPTQNIASDVLENFQGGLNFLSDGLSPLQLTPSAAASENVFECLLKKKYVFVIYQ